MKFQKKNGGEKIGICRAYEIPKKNGGEKIGICRAYEIPKKNWNL